MCGIAGLFDLRGRRDFSRELAVRINDIQHHRGPDEGAVHLEPGVALCHRRLSIIDIATGQQPLFNEDGSVGVVFNGEIYNFLDLVPELQELGHVFRTRSDTEVIVHAWEAWGEECVTRFRGMFAFALFDRNRRVLFLARDRLGVKPLHYAPLDDGTLIFGSELKAITAHPSFRRAIDPLAVEEYFALGYVAEPRTVYRDAYKLPPGHTLLIGRGSGSACTPRRYWDVKFRLDNTIGAREAQEELKARVVESVRLRLMSEVPLGAFLSGGVDSSVVVAAMSGLLPEPVRTCAIGFTDSAFDESRYAQMVAERCGANHRLRIMNGEDYGLIDRLAWLYDEPFADSSAMPTYRVCGLARQDVTVALSGDGGDESFGGYRRYRLHLAEQRWRDRLPPGLRSGLFGALGAVYPKLDRLPRMFRAKTTFQAMAVGAVEAYFRGVSLLREEERTRIYAPSFERSLGGYRALEVFKRHAGAAGTDDPLALIQYLDYQTWLVGDINTKVDRASMAHSLEVREPLMDHVLVEWMATIPSAFKVRGGESKWLFKKMAEPMLPREILYRPKMGFSVPLARWLRGPLRDRLLEACRGERLGGQGIFDMDALSDIAGDHLAGRRDYGGLLWSVLMFDAFLANAGAPGAPVEQPVEDAR